MLGQTDGWNFPPVLLDIVSFGSAAQKGRSIGQPVGGVCVADQSNIFSELLYHLGNVELEAAGESTIKVEEESFSSCVEDDSQTGLLGESSDGAVFSSSSSGRR